MNVGKKLCALLLVAAMCVGMSVTALATADIPGETPNVTPVEQLVANANIMQTNGYSLALSRGDHEDTYTSDPIKCKFHYHGLLHGWEYTKYEIRAQYVRTDLIVVGLIMPTASYPGDRDLTYTYTVQNGTKTTNSEQISQSVTKKYGSSFSIGTGKDAKTALGFNLSSEVSITNSITEVTTEETSQSTTAGTGMTLSAGKDPAGKYAVVQAVAADLYYVEEVDVDKEPGTVKGDDKDRGTSAPGYQYIFNSGSPTTYYLYSDATTSVDTPFAINSIIATTTDRLDSKYVGRPTVNPGTGTGTGSGTGSGTGTGTSIIVNFGDVTNNWAYNSIVNVVNLGLMNGTSDSTFSPTSTMTRAMLVTMLYRMAGSPEVTSACPFSDVSADSWYGKAVIWAAANGIVTGNTDGTFCPNGTVTREQIAAILSRYAALQNKDTSANAAALEFADATSVSAYAVPAMQWAVGNGLFNGYSDGTLRPANGGSRQEIAAVISRFIDQFQIPVASAA